MMNVIPGGAAVLISALAVIASILIYAVLTDLYTKRQKKKAVEKMMQTDAEQKRADRHHELFEQVRLDMNRQDEQIKQMLRDIEASDKRKAREKLRRRFLGSHR